MVVEFSSTGDAMANSSIRGVLSFQITTCDDFLDGLRHVVQEFLDDDLDSRRAVTSALWAWHMHEWIYHLKRDEVHKHCCKNFSDEKGFAEWLLVQPERTSLAIIKDIANGSKHCMLNRPVPGETQTMLHNGGFSDAFDDGFDISRLEVKFAKNIHGFRLALMQVLAFWETLLPKLT